MGRIEIYGRIAPLAKASLPAAMASISQNATYFDVNAVRRQQKRLR